MSNRDILQANTINSTTISNQAGIYSFSLFTPFISSSTATLDIGLSNATTNIWNANTIVGRGSNFPMYMSMVESINQVPAIPTGVIYIQVNFDGFKQVCVPLIPTFTRSDTQCYPLSNPNYLSTDGYTLSGKSELLIYDQFLTLLSSHTNSGDTPRFFSNGDLILNTPNRLYSYRVLLNAL
jgi:hypothetical protein